MKILPGLICILLFCSCAYDPPGEGTELVLHNQTREPLIILDSLTGKDWQLFDTASVNGRRYISRRPNYMAEYSSYHKFYSTGYLDSLRKKETGKIRIYMANPNRHLLRSFEIMVDTLKEYDLNHLFIGRDSLWFEHNYDFHTNQKL